MNVIQNFKRRYIPYARHGSVLKFDTGGWFDSLNDVDDYSTLGLYGYYYDKDNKNWYLNDAREQGTQSTLNDYNYGYDNKDWNIRDLEETDNYKNFFNALTDQDGNLTSLGQKYLKQQAQLNQSWVNKWFTKGNDGNYSWKGNYSPSQTEYGSNGDITNARIFFNRIAFDQKLSQGHNVLKGNLYRNKEGKYKLLTDNDLSKYQLVSDDGNYLWNVYTDDTGINTGNGDEESGNIDLENGSGRLGGYQNYDLSGLNMNWKSSLNLLPEAIATYRTLMNRRSNNKIADVMQKSLHTPLHNPFEKNSPITGDFASMKYASEQAYHDMYTAGKNFQTSDASLALANQREIQNDAYAKVRKGQLADNEAIQESLERQRKNRHESIENRNEVANDNIDALAKTSWKRGQIEASRQRLNRKQSDYLWKYFGNEAQKNREEQQYNNLLYGSKYLKSQYDLQKNIVDSYFKQRYPGKNIDTIPEYIDAVSQLRSGYLENTGKFANSYKWRKPTGLSISYNGKTYNNFNDWWSNYLSSIEDPKKKSAKHGVKLFPKMRFKNGGKPVILFKKKFQEGGEFDDYFYAADVGYDSSKSTKSSAATTTKSSDDDLTDKDILNLFKDIDGLPNEMVLKVNEFKQELQYANITGDNVSTLASSYLNTLLDLQILKQNKKKYDDAMQTAKENGSLNEIALSSDGRSYIAQTKDGKLVTVKPQQYKNNKSKYALLTNAQLAQLRAYQPELVNNQSIFNIIQNSVGFDSFQKALNLANITLGTRGQNTAGSVVLENDISKAQKGMAALQLLNQNEKIQLLSSMYDSGSGKYRYSKRTQSNLEDIAAYMNYLVAALPNNMKLWATTKTKQTNPNLAAYELIKTYLSGKISTQDDFNVYYSSSSKGSGGGDGSSASDKKDDQKIGFWGQVQRGMGGTPTIVQIQKGTTNMSVSGIQYGMSEGMEMSYQSLKQYLQDSKLPYIKSAKITFGDQVLADYNDIAINGADGITVATLPKNPDGTVNFSMMDEFTKITEKLQAEDLHPGDPDYNRRLNEEIEKSGKFPSLYKNGHLNIESYGNFILINGIASDKTRIKEGNSQKRISLGDTGSEWIVHNQDYEEDLIGALSTDDKEYDINQQDFWEPDWTPWKTHDFVYQGVIYIPINNNLINGMNADDEDMKMPSAESFEKNAQDWRKRMSAGSTSTDLLIGNS